jgi:hypothetical protein
MLTLQRDLLFSESGFLNYPENQRLGRPDMSVLVVAKGAIDCGNAIAATMRGSGSIAALS